MRLGEGPGAVDLELLTSDDVGIDRHRATVRVLPEHQVATVAAGQLEPFRYRAWHPGALQNHVRSPATGRFGQHLALALDRVRIGEDVDVDVADTDLPCQIETASRTSDQDRFGRAGKLRVHRRRQTDRTATLD